MTKKINMYFCNFNNFGDALNKYIFKNCFNIDIEYADSWSCDFIGIGSILENMLIQTKDIKYFFKIFSKLKKPVYVLSSGFGWQDEHYIERVRFFYNMIFKRKLNIISLRGELTKKSVQNILKKDLNNVPIGDLGLLASFLLTEKSPKKYDVGIIPHYADSNSPIFDTIFYENPNSVMLDTRMEPLEFIQKMDKCKTIVSTGLHPLICADALGIPNVWGRICEQTTTRHKYADYYSIYGFSPMPCDLNKTKISRQFIEENYKIKKEQVAEIQNNMLTLYKDFFAKL